MNKNIFISGGLGQDGIILTKLLTQKKNIDLNIFCKSRKKISNKEVKYISTNLLDKKKLDKIFFKKKPNIVIHLASNNPSYKEKSYKIFYKDNFLATKNIFFSTFKANNKAKFIFCNSSQIFRKKTGKVSEKSIFNPTSDYTKFRIDSHKLMIKYKKKHKINYTNVILFNHDSKYRNKKFLLPKIIKAIIRKNTNFLNEIIDSYIVSDFSHANDICNGLKKIMFSKLSLDNVILSYNKLTSINDIILYIVKKNKLKIKIKYKTKVLKGLIGNNKLAKKKFNWSLKKNIFQAANEIYNSL